MHSNQKKNLCIYAFAAAIGLLTVATLTRKSWIPFQAAGPISYLQDAEASVHAIARVLQQGLPLSRITLREQPLLRSAVLLHLFPEFLIQAEVLDKMGQEYVLLSEATLPQDASEQRQMFIIASGLNATFECGLSDDIVWKIKFEGSSRTPVVSESSYADGLYLKHGAHIADRMRDGLVSWLVCGAFFAMLTSARGGRLLAWLLVVAPVCWVASIWMWFEFGTLWKLSQPATHWTELIWPASLEIGLLLGVALLVALVRAVRPERLSRSTTADGSAEGTPL